MGKKSRRNRTTTKDERKANKKKTVENVIKRYTMLEMQQLLDMQAKYGGLDAWQRTIMNQVGVARQKDADFVINAKR
tara:strand:+ start:22 stop:252 length:231 start_codon:yes stop_codon:yes gene_type:complete